MITSTSLRGRAWSPPPRNSSSPGTSSEPPQSAQRRSRGPRDQDPPHPYAPPGIVTTLGPARRRGAQGRCVSRGCANGRERRRATRSSAALKGGARSGAGSHRVLPMIRAARKVRGSRVHLTASHFLFRDSYPSSIHQQLPAGRGRHRGFVSMIIAANRHGQRGRHGRPMVR